MSKFLIVLPVFNEEQIIKQNVLKLLDFCYGKLSDFNWQILISDNASTDKTAEIARELTSQDQRIKYFYLKQKGKGGAIREAWQESDADIYCFMDIDLATDLEVLPFAVELLKKGDFDLIIGSRFKKNSIVTRSLGRHIFSYGYSFLLKIVFNLKTNDAPCGFKLVNKKIVKDLLPQIKNNQWFFDSELVILAEKQNYKIKEIAIKWIDKDKKGRRSKVKILSLIYNYLKEVIMLKWRLTRS